MPCWEVPLRLQSTFQCSARAQTQLPSQVRTGVGPKLGPCQLCVSKDEVGLSALNQPEEGQVATDAPVPMLEGQVDGTWDI
jgi:hypothetical protein